MKVFISADIEGINGICDWDETEYGHNRYFEFQRQMTNEVKMACEGAKNAGADEILVKDAHDSAMNLLVNELPEYITLHRGWEVNICSMMAGLDKSFDAVIFIGYHSPSRSEGNSLSHTMNTKIWHVKINGVIASEFDINSLYASYLGVPVAFLSGDLNLTSLVKQVNPNIEVVATKAGQRGATVSKHPKVTNQAILETVEKSLKKNLTNNVVKLPEKFDIEIQYRTHQAAHRAALYPGCKLSGSDAITFSSNDYYEVLRMFKFNL